MNKDRRVLFTPDHLAAIAKTAKWSLRISEVAQTADLSDKVRASIKKDRDCLFKVLGLTEEALAANTLVLFTPDLLISLLSAIDLINRKDKRADFTPREYKLINEVRDTILEYQNQEFHLTMSQQRVKRTGPI